jgi:uncharacterized membrane protein YbhN (UPF0104 family)
VSAAFVAVTTIFITRNLIGARSQLETTAYRDVELLLPALLLMTVAVVAMALAWMGLINRLAPRPGPRWRLVRFFLIVWPSRYLPGTLPYHASRVLMAERLGESRVVLFASISYETFFLLSSGGFLGCLALLVGLGVQSNWWVYLLGALILACLPLALQPRILVPLFNHGLRTLGRSAIGREFFLNLRQTAASFAGYLAVHTINGVGFFLVLAAIVGSDANAAVAIGAYTLAGVAGAAVFFVPSGIGVREAVIVGLLSSTVPLEDGLVAAAAARALSIIADLLPILIVGGFAFIRSLSHFASKRTSSIQSPHGFTKARPAVNGDRGD